MDPKGSWWLAVGAVVILAVAGGIIYSSRRGSGSVGPTPSPVMVEQLPVEQQPQAELAFSADGHEVTVNISNLHASKLEYNLVYDASVKKGREVSQIQTGVTGGGDID